MKGILFVKNFAILVWHLNVSLVAMHKEYYKGEGDGFPQVQAVVSFVSSWLPMARSCTKSVPITH
jgi:hypothetical protein